MDLKIEVASRYSLAAQQNMIPFLSVMQLIHTGEETVDDVLITATFDPPVFEPCSWPIDQIAPNQSVNLSCQNLKISADKLAQLRERTLVNIKVTASNQGIVLAEEHRETEFLPKNHWGGESTMPELLAAYITPNEAYVEKLLKSAAELLKDNGHDSRLDGYQSNTRERPYLVADAIWSIISCEQITYTVPPASFATNGQKVRLPNHIEESRLATCLDTALLFAACLEQAGLNPIVALTNGHAIAGAWLIDESFPTLTNDDPMDIRKKVAVQDLVIFETTLVTSDNFISFMQAQEAAKDCISEENASNFVYALDVKQARTRKINPLSGINQARTSSSSLVKKADVPPELGLIPHLPPVRSIEISEEITSDTRIEQWRRKLLDLSRRNKLINLSRSAVTLPVFCPYLEYLKDQLAAGKAFSFITPVKSPTASGERDPDLYRFSTWNDLEHEFSSEQLKKGTLIANLSERDLTKNSIALLRTAKTDMEEGGANTLFISLGFLKWKEAENSGKSYKAPLILLPVKLSRRSAVSKINIAQILDEEPVFNLTLIQLLKQDFAIDLKCFQNELPQNNSGIDVAAILRIVREKIKDVPGFEVLEDLVVSTFSFTRYLMWRDLTYRIDDLKNNFLVKHLIDRPGQIYPHSADFIKPEDVDSLLSSKDLFIPLNADSSQIVAINASASGNDFVLEGPPGTGKSETIANIIAHNIAIGRKILFVAEKMAALTVVYSRLEKIGLGHLCLELHSNKATKKGVVNQLDQAWRSGNNDLENNFSNDTKKLDDLKIRINKVVAALHCPSMFDLSARDAMARSIRYQEFVPVSLDWGFALNKAPIENKDELDCMLDCVHAFALAFEEVSSTDISNFEYLKNTGWSFAWQSNYIDSSIELLNNVIKYSNTLGSMKDSFGFDSIDDEWKSVPIWQTMAEQIIAYAESPLKAAVGENAKQFVKNIQSLAAKKNELDSLVAVNHLSIPLSEVTRWDVDEWIRKLDQSSQQNYLLKKITRWRLQLKIKKAGVVNPNLDQLDNYKNIVNLAVDIECHLSNKDINFLWDGWNMTGDSIAQMAARAKGFRDAIVALVPLFPNSEKALAKIKEQLIDGEKFLDASKLLALAKRIQEDASVLNSSIEKFTTLTCEKFDSNITIEAVLNYLKMIPKNKDKLSGWCKLQGEKKTISKYQINSFINAIENGLIAPKNARENLLTIFCTWLAKRLIDNSENISGFSSSQHQSDIDRFRALDKQIADSTARCIANIYSSKTPDRQDRSAPKEYGILSREIQKKQRHMPVRELIAELNENLLNLVPCVMMSPLSVAQYLPKDFPQFDLVVFDEASQITVWDAVGAIARGKNAIVVGDPKQMPPTNCFNKTGADDSDEEEDLESILDQALAASVPHHRLTGHYRSKHESLIRFSNIQYYHNTLITYPSNDTKLSAVKWHRVEGLYSKGGSSKINPLEAKALVEFLVSKLKDPMLKGLSLGVITMNTDQQRLIQDLLDDQRREHLDIEKYFSDDAKEPVFVKNLETVQGDQRDIILLSIGYGPTEPAAKTMSMNFGPLNRQGGERRLNVAITRATTEVHLFTSFDASMIDLSRTKSEAIRHLKTYIDFADRGDIAIARGETSLYGADRFDSDFEESVAIKLRARGWNVRTQVGVSKFRIDLGVVHPDKDGKFLAGVECDGATYHRSPTARDRDRIRHAVLENLGWSLIRIWSTDFFKDPDSIITRVCNDLDQLLKDSRSVVEQVHEAESEGNIANVHNNAVVSISHNNSCLQLNKSIAPRDSVPEISASSALTFNAQRDEYKLATKSAAVNNVRINVSNKEQFDYSPDSFWKESHKPDISDMAKVILKKNGPMTFKELVDLIVRKYKILKTSKKQISWVAAAVSNWAVYTDHAGEERTIWSSKEDVKDVIKFRGHKYWSQDKRYWRMLPVEEQKGLALLAKKESPSNPVEWIFKTFNLQQRRKKTEQVFQSWVDGSDEFSDQ